MLKNIEIVSAITIIGATLYTVYLKWLKPEKRFVNLISNEKISTDLKVSQPKVMDKFLIKQLEQFDKIINYSKLTKDFKKLPEIMTLPTFRQLQNRILGSGKEAVGVSSYKVREFKIIEEKEVSDKLRVLKIVRYREKKMGGVLVPMGVPYKEIWDLIQVDQKIIIGGITLV